jgi:hypothetical protein
VEPFALLAAPGGGKGEYRWWSLAMAGDVPFLVADRLTRAYGATLALDHVDLTAREAVLRVRAA